MAKEIYNLTADAVLRKFGTSRSGLADEEARERLKKYGLNRIKKKRGWRWLKIAFSQFNDVLVWIMLVAAGLAYFFGEPRDVIILLLIIFINSIIGFVQEFKAEKLMDRLQKLSSDKAIVVRSGKKREIETRSAVPGDIVYVTGGDNIPADGYLLETFNFYTNSFVFTGESRPERKEAKAVSEKKLSVADIGNMVFSGEQVTRGEAVFVATATGMQTELGKIADLAEEIPEEPTPLQKNMKTLGRDITILSIFIAIFVLLAGRLQPISLYENFLFALAVAVSIVPEGLPATLSVALSLGMRRLLSKKVLVRRLIAVETLGSVDVICTDKTGTITKNELAVTKIIIGGKEIEVTGNGYEPKGTFLSAGKKIDPDQIKNFQLLLKIGVLCNDASLMKEKGEYKIVGDPTEGALVVAARKFNPKPDFFGKGERKVHENPFESERMRMSVVYERKSGPKKELVSYVKGSPDVLLGLSPKKIGKEGTVPFSQEEKEKTKQLYDEMSARALRVLAFAYRPLGNKFSNKTRPDNITAEEAESDLVWVGMMAMIDPPRPDIERAIAECRESGVNVIMITGDYEVTARAIAQKINLLRIQKSKVKSQNFGVPASGADNFVVNGKTLNDLSDGEIVARIKSGTSVFARITPAQKLRIAQALKKSGLVIAMTGDGVNDAPALKSADIGVAMGKIGTDVSKEASDMILLNDNFSSIVSGIREGRTIYQNIRKIMYYILSSNASEFLAIAFGMLMAIPSPVTAVQILAIDLGTDVLPSMALGVEPAEKHKLERGKIGLKQGLIGSLGFFRLLYVGVIMASGAIFAFLWSMVRGGWHFGQAMGLDSPLYIKSTAATFAVLSMTQMANLLQARSENKSVFEIGFFKNKYLIGSIFFAIAVLFMFLYVPFFQKHLHLAPIDFWDWMIVIGATLAVFFFEEARKAGEK